MATATAVLFFGVVFLPAAMLVADAATVEHTFIISNLTITRGCATRTVAAVNGRTPGPTIDVHEGDTLLVHAVNRSPYNMSLHWHGVFQRRTCWADGANLVTQCPIQPGRSYSYRFDITGQEGTLWWHAHISFLRETVHGALVIRPSRGSVYPFPRPDAEVPIILGEWWNVDVVSVDRQAFLTGGPTRPADALTINGDVGDFNNCSTLGANIYRLRVEQGKTYLLRIINAAVNNQFFFKIAGHSFTVVAVDASYTKPYETDVIVIAPGQTVDALMAADAHPGRYYMAARVLETANPPAPIFVNGTATAVIEYSDDLPWHPVLPDLPAFNDTTVSERFLGGLRGLLRPGRPAVPAHVDERMSVTVGLGFADCLPSQTLCNGTSLAASMNNMSFLFPTELPLLSAVSTHLVSNSSGGGTDQTPRRREKLHWWTSELPDRPALLFDFTNVSVNTDPGLAALLQTVKETTVKRLRYNATVEVVLQNTAIIGTESHPLHLHGHNMFEVARGPGNYDDAIRAGASLNLVDPVERNTVAVPGGGWAVVRFIANNPGVWLMHCHIDTHLRLGLATIFQVGNGPTADAVLPPPPPDFPRC